jgi:lysozyme
MTPAKAAAGVAAVLTAAALITPRIAGWEGWRLGSYRDVAGVVTACAGATKGVVPGRRFTDRHCMDLLARDVVEHGMAIDRCIAGPLPAASRAAFTSLAYNIGAANFCRSTLVKKLNAGDLRGACAEISRWNRAGGRILPGLVRRRAEERTYCEGGLAMGAAG